MSLLRSGATGRDGLLPFVKMQSCGNDFIVLDGRRRLPLEPQLLARQLAQRRFGVGADGVIVLQGSKSADFSMLYYNADGSEAVCGNGLRCLSRYVYDSGLLPQGRKAFDVQTSDRNAAVEVLGRGERVKIDMGCAVFAGRLIPTAEDGKHFERVFTVGESTITGTAVGMGNPHCVIFVSDVEEAEVELIGPSVENDSFYPKRTNVEFVEVVSSTHVRMRVWERGVGETLSCGTGACAALAVAVELGKTAREIVVETRGGELEALLDRQTERIALIGPAEIVYRGEVDLDVVTQ